MGKKAEKKSKENRRHALDTRAGKSTDKHNARVRAKVRGGARSAKLGPARIHIAAIAQHREGLVDGLGDLSALEKNLSLFVGDDAHACAEHIAAQKASGVSMRDLMGELALMLLMYKLEPELRKAIGRCFKTLCFSECSNAVTWSANIGNICAEVALPGIRSGANSVFKDHFAGVEGFNVSKHVYVAFYQPRGEEVGDVEGEVTLSGAGVEWFADLVFPDRPAQVAMDSSTD